MAINLITEYSTLLDKRFTQKSLTEAFCGHDYSWDGENSIKVFTIDPVTIQDYNTTGTNRFSGGNAPTNLGDEVNTYTLAKKRGFSTILEGTQGQDQKNIKKANAVLKQIWDEQMVPEIDKYRLQTWANGAGHTVINSTALTKSTIIEQILKAQAHLNNKLVNRDGRVCFITETMAVQTKLASELSYNPAYTSKAIVNGEVARLGGLPIVAIPDDWMPTGIEFMVKYKRASTDPTKLKMLRVLSHVQGIYGDVLEGLTRYDSFVLANKADGIYVYGTGSILPEPTITVASGTATMSSTNATTIYYTTDGSNPKTSSTRAAYNGSSKPGSLTEGTVIKAYGEASGYTSSGIATHVVTGSED